MIRARLHKSSLDESMKTSQNFASIADMKQWFVDSCNHMFSAEDIIIDDEVIYDSRTDWNMRFGRGTFVGKVFLMKWKEGK